MASSPLSPGVPALPLIRSAVEEEPHRSSLPFPVSTAAQRLTDMLSDINALERQHRFPAPPGGERPKQPRGRGGTTVRRDKGTGQPQYARPTRVWVCKQSVNAGPACKASHRYLQERLAYLRSLDADQLREWRLDVFHELRQRLQHQAALQSPRSPSAALPTAKTWSENVQRARHARTEGLLDKAARVRESFDRGLGRQRQAEERRSHAFTDEELRAMAMQTMLVLHSSVTVVRALIRHRHHLCGMSAREYVLAKEYSQQWSKAVRRRVKEREAKESSAAVQNICRKLIFVSRVRRKSRSAVRIACFLRAVRESRAFAMRVHDVIGRVRHMGHWWLRSLACRAACLSLVMRQWMAYSEQMTTASERGKKKKLAIVKRSPMWAAAAEGGVAAYLHATSFNRRNAAPDSEMEMLQSLCGEWVYACSRANASKWNAYERAVGAYVKEKAEKTGQRPHASPHSLSQAVRQYFTTCSSAEERACASELGLTMPQKPQLRHLMDKDELCEVSRRLASVRWASDKRLQRRVA